MFLDQDVLVLRDLSPYIDKLASHDFVAFGKASLPNATRITAPSVRLPTDATPDTDTHVDIHVETNTDLVMRNARMEERTTSPSTTETFVPPLTWAMASRPRGRLVTLARDRCYWLLDNQRSRLLNERHLFGRSMLVECIRLLSVNSTPSSSWSFFHVSSVCSQCDEKGIEFTKDRFLMNESISAECVQSMFLVPLRTHADTDVCAFPQWFEYAQREQLLGNGNTLASKLWRWSLLDETPFEVENDVQFVGSMPTVSVPQFYVSGPLS
jgi:hypothetical protein